jgi:hypothetical protein
MKLGYFSGPLDDGGPGSRAWRFGGFRLGWDWRLLHIFMSIIRV